MNNSVKEAAAALLQVQSDLHRLLLQRPESPEELSAWRAGVSAALIEAARGRIYLSRLVEGGEREAARRPVRRARFGDERLAS